MHYTHQLSSWKKWKTNAQNTQICEKCVSLQMFRPRRDDIMDIGVIWRLGFDVLELRKFKLSVKNKATRTPLGMFIDSPKCMRMAGILPIMQFWAIPIFILRGAFCVARFDWQGNAKASTRGTGDRTGSTFCVHWWANQNNYNLQL